MNLYKTALDDTKRNKRKPLTELYLGSLIGEGTAKKENEIIERQ